MSSEFIQDLTRTLKVHEGLELKPYRCTADKLTIGVGRNLEDVGITEAEADFLLSNDIQRVVAALDVRIPWWNNLPIGKRVVLASMAFQLGIGGLMQFRKFLAAAERGDDDDAIAQMKDSRWYRQTPKRVDQLIKRWLEK